MIEQINGWDVLFTITSIFTLFIGLVIGNLVGKKTTLNKAEDWCENHQNMDGYMQIDLLRSLE